MENVFRTARPKPDKKTSHVLLEFGHFIVQDVLGSATNATEPWDVPCDGDLHDLLFCPATGRQYGSGSDGCDNDNSSSVSVSMMEFFRSTHVMVRDDDETETTRQEGGRLRRATINGMTAFLDLSNVYGITDAETKRMRRGVGGDAPPQRR